MATCSKFICPFQRTGGLEGRGPAVASQPAGSLVESPEPGSSYYLAETYIELVTVEGEARQGNSSVAIQFLHTKAKVTATRNQEVPFRLRTLSLVPPYSDCNRRPCDACNGPKKVRVRGDCAFCMEGRSRDEEGESPVEDTRQEMAGKGEGEVTKTEAQ